MIHLISAKVEKVPVDIQDTFKKYHTGYEVVVTVSMADQQTTFRTNSLLVTTDQDADWCEQQCVKFAASIPETLSFGQLLKIAHSYKPLEELGIPVPPQQPFAVYGKEAEEWSRKSGKPMVYYYNVQYQEWVRQYNAWQREHPDLANQYGCSFQDENWRPVQ